MAHADTIARHFEDGLTISQMEATGLYQMPRLTRVIHDMIHRRGWKIDTIIRETRTGQRYARYVPRTRPDGTPVELVERERVALGEG